MDYDYDYDYDDYDYETYTGDVKVYAKARIEVVAKLGVPHDRTKDIEEVIAVIERESDIVYCAHRIDDSEDMGDLITIYIVDVVYLRPCEFEEVMGGEPDERLLEPIDITFDPEYEGKDEFETDDLIISITDIDDIETDYELI